MPGFKLPGGVVRFEGFQLDLPSGELRQNGGKVVRLSEQPFQILVMLLEHPREVVTRDEIRNRLWPNDTIVEFEHSISAAMNRLRQALGDTADNPHYIETLARRGYRWMVAVEWVEATPANAPKEVPLNARSESESEPRSNRITRIWAGVAAIVGVVVIASILVPILRVPAAPKILRYVQITNDGVAKCVNGCGPPAQVSDGSRVYFTETLPLDWVVAQTSVGGGEVVRLPATFRGAQYVNVLDISPDRSQLLVSAEPVEKGLRLEALLWVLHLPDGFARRLGDLTVSDATWSPDGQSIAYSKGDGLFVANADGSGSRKLVTLPGLATAFRLPVMPRWSPDARVLRFTATDNGRSTLWEVSASGRDLHPLFAPGSNPRGASECCGAWTPDGKYFVYNSIRDGLATISVIRESRGLFRRTRSEPVQLTAGPTFRGTENGWLT